jgi:LysR family transcriptional regulator, low CO2-responsive transcriptional regulator
VPEERMRIFQSGAAALEETQRGNGVSLAPSFVVAQDLAAGRLVKLAGPTLTADGIWSALTMPDQMSGTAVAELTRFVSTPRATQAMLRGSGVNVGHFKPSVHVTLWS